MEPQQTKKKRGTESTARESADMCFALQLLVWLNQKKKPDFFFLKIP